MEKTQAEIIAQLEQDYKQAREKGMSYRWISDYYLYPSQRMAKMTGVSLTLTTRPWLRRILTPNPNLENETDSNSLHVIIATY